MEYRRTSLTISPCLAFILSLIVSVLPIFSGCGSEADSQTDLLASTSGEKLDSAWQNIHMANWPAAESILTPLIENDDKSIAAEALYALAHVNHYRNPGANPEQARRLYTIVVDNYKNSAIRPWAMLALARFDALPASEANYKQSHAQTEEKLRIAYQQILDEYPGHECSHEAALWLAMLDIENYPDKAARKRGAEFLSAYLGQYPDNFLFTTMNTVLGRYYQSLNDYCRAETHYIAAANNGYASVYDAAQEFYRIARIAEYELKDIALARTWYFKLITELPRSFRYYPSVQALNRCNESLGLPKYEVELD